MMRPMTERKNSRRAAALSGLAWNSFIRVIGISPYPYADRPLVKMRAAVVLHNRDSLH